MKKHKSYILALGIALPLLTACGSDDSLQGTDGQTVPVSVSVSTRATDGSTDSYTATDWEWASGDKIKLYITSTYGGTSTSTDELTYDGSSWAASDGSAITATLPAKAYAVYPTSATNTAFTLPRTGITKYTLVSPYTVEYQIDQSSIDKLKACDWLVSDEATVNGDAISLTMKHKLCKATVNITYSGWNTDPTIENVKFYTFAYYTTGGDLNYLSEVSPYKVPDNNQYVAIMSGGYYLRALYLMSLEVNTVEKKIMVPSNFIYLSSGYSYNFELTVKPDEVSISSVSSSVDWTEDSGSYTGSVEISN
ncbi:MAG: fimbrillin family protein [Bacteroides sp.]|nr:fimbrillin family protein [Bacteroides sp.]